MGLSLNSKLAEELCYRLCRWRFIRRNNGSAGARQSTLSDEAYWEWRNKELRDQFATHFSHDLVRDKDVLDFGCGEGHLSFYIAEMQPKSVKGLEIVEYGVQLANEQLERQPPTVPIQFIHSPAADKVALPDDSVDVILCFDVLEHIMCFREILAEWRRILRKGGRVLIWWVPWLNPWGPHIESLVPIPWAHVFFSERVLIRTCARIRDMQEYQPRVWDFDDDGQPLPNKWHDMVELPEVNRLTIRQFENALVEEGLRTESRKIDGFGGSTLSRLSKPFANLPVLREYLASCVTYVISK